MYLATLTYEFLCRNGLSEETVSRALRFATKTLRDRWVAQQRGKGLPGKTIRTTEIGAEMYMKMWK